MLVSSYSYFVERVGELNIETPQKFLYNYGNNLPLALDDMTDDELEVIDSIGRGKNVILFRNKKNSDRIGDLLLTIHISHVPQNKLRRNHKIYYMCDSHDHKDRYHYKVTDFLSSGMVKGYKDVVKAYDLPSIYPSTLTKLMTRLRGVDTLVMMDKLSDHPNKLDFTQFIDSVPDKSSKLMRQYIAVLDKEDTHSEFVDSIKHIFDHPEVVTIYL